MNLDLRLSIPVAFAWIATVFVIGAPTAAEMLAIALWLSAGLLTAGALLCERQFVASLALACALAALCSTSVAIQTISRQPLALNELAHQHTSVTAIATTTAVARSDSDYFAATISQLEVNGSALVLNSPALIFTERSTVDSEKNPRSHERSGIQQAGVDRSKESWGIGVNFTVTGTISNTEPGDGRAVLLFATEEPVWRAAPRWHVDWANQLRRTFATATTQLPGGGGELLGGLAIGDKSAVSDEVDAAMKTSSLSHLTAVSGANCAIIVGLMMALGGRARVRRTVRIGAAILMLLAFVIIVTPDPSVLRASLMATFVLIALGGGRPIRGMAVLSLATIVLLVFDPWLSRNFAFVLSVFATAGLLLFAEPLSRLLSRWMPPWLALVIAVPAAAQLTCQPVLLLLQPSLPTYGVVANVLAAPAAPIATVVGLAACVALTAVPPLGFGLMWIAWVPSAWVAAVAEFFSQAPGARIPWWEGWAGVVALSVLTLLVLAALMASGRWRRRACWSLAVATILTIAVVAGSALGQAITQPRDWQFAQCDVGQGDAVMVRSAGEITLIDTGSDPELLDVCLDALAIDHIDLLVLTHFDHDHVGGIDAVVGRVDAVLIGPHKGPEDGQLLETMAAAGARIDTVQSGDRGQVGELWWRVLWPPERLAGIDPGNDASVVVEFRPRPDCQHQCLSAIFLGDLGAETQARLLRGTRISPVDVVKVSHHGSGDQYPALYTAVGATVGLIGVGADNGYGHPTDDALRMLQNAGIETVRSDQHGLVLVSSTGRSGVVSVWSQRDVGRRQ